jgi:hypothetical protein
MDSIKATQYHVTLHPKKPVANLVTVLTLENEINKTNTSGFQLLDILSTAQRPLCLREMH